MSVNPPGSVEFIAQLPFVAGESDLSADRLKERFYPESRLVGFSNVDGSLIFYSQIAALLRPEYRVLEFGAGRGANVAEVHAPYVRALQSFKGRCSKVVGCDIDPAVHENPYIDEAVQIAPDGALPFADASFDLIVSSWVFEHVEHAENTAAELLRVVKPGGVIAARTPNKWGYVAMASRLVRNAWHSRALKKVQPGRKEIDVFPTLYRMNTPSALRRLFGAQAEVIVARSFSEPSYHFNRAPIYRMFKAAHSLLPDLFATTLLVYIRRHDGQS